MTRSKTHGHLTVCRSLLPLVLLGGGLVQARPDQDQARAQAKPGPSVTPGSTYHVHAPSGLRLWSTPGIQGQQLVFAPDGTTIKVLDTRADPWWKCQVQGKTGFMWKGYLEPGAGTLNLVIRRPGKDGGVSATGLLRKPLPNEDQGTLRLLIYNVAGLPGIVSKLDPKRNIPKISPKLNRYPLVLVQESFWYYRKLKRRAKHPYRSKRQRNFLRFPLRLVNDGLNRLSRSPFTHFKRVRWRVFHGVTKQGNDGLARKGFSVARHHLALGVSLDVYNLHADAGDSAGDQRARAAQYEQLAAFIARYSQGRAVIVAGDTNLKSPRAPDLKTLNTFLARTRTKEVARTLGHPEQIDRFIWRSSPRLELRPVRLIRATEFVDEVGDPLSDHPALYADFAWRKR